MPVASHDVFSTNWKSVCAGSKRDTRISEMPKVTSVVHSAIQRELRRAASSSPRLAQITSAPNSGRNVTTERMGQVTISLASHEHEPGDQAGDADQHREGVVIEIAGLDLYDVAGDVEHPRRHAVGTEAVDDGAVAFLPELIADPLGRPHEDQVVQLVEIPFVEQELVQHRLLRREVLRQIGSADGEDVGDEKTAGHHHEGQG